MHDGHCFSRISWKCTMRSLKTEFQKHCSDPNDKFDSLMTCVYSLWHGRCIVLASLNPSTIIIGIVDFSCPWFVLYAYNAHLLGSAKSVFSPRVKKLSQRFLKIDLTRQFAIFFSFGVIQQGNLPSYKMSFLALKYKSMFLLLLSGIENRDRPEVEFRFRFRPEHWNRNRNRTRIVNFRKGGKIFGGGGGQNSKSENTLKTSF